MSEELKDFAEWFESIFEMMKEANSMRKYDIEIEALVDEWMPLSVKAFEMAVEYCKPEVINRRTREDQEGNIWELRDFKYKDFEISNCRRVVAENV